MSDQGGFLFDAPLEHVPAPQLPPPLAKPVIAAHDGQALIAQALAALPELPDDVSIDDVLDCIAMPTVIRTGWHRARVMDALLSGNAGVLGQGEFSSYLPNGPGGGVRFKRKARTAT